MNHESPVTIVVGSENETKVMACRDAIIPRIPTVDILTAAVDSGVSKQPVGIEETRLGANNRANSALATVPADLGLGIEAGLLTLDGMETRWISHWIYLSTEERAFEACGPLLPIPPEIDQRLEHGETLSSILENKHSKAPGPGLAGLITHGWLDRVDMIRPAIAAVIGQWIATHSSDVSN